MRAAPAAFTCRLGGTDRECLNLRPRFSSHHPSDWCFAIARRDRDAPPKPKPTDHFTTATRGAFARAAAGCAITAGPAHGAYTNHDVRRASRALRSLRPRRSGVALWTLWACWSSRSGFTLRACWARWAGIALRPCWAGVALGSRWTLRARFARFALRPLGALRSRWAWRPGWSDLVPVDVLQVRIIDHGTGVAFSS
jgi:hypothetical protein